MCHVAVPVERRRAPTVARELAADRRTVRGERHHVEPLQPLSSHHRPVRPGDRLHHERVPQQEDHQDEVRVTHGRPDEPGLGKPGLA